MYDSRKPLWVNVSLLMSKRYGGENLNRLAREAKVSPATATRLKAQQTSVGLETIDRLAAYFGVKPHELISPTHEPVQSHTTLSPLAADLAHSLDSIKDPVQHQRAYALAIQLIEFGQLSRNLSNQQPWGAQPTNDDGKAPANAVEPTPSLSRDR